jgi:hypothetical protein
MQWEALSRNARRRCESTNTGSCWLAPVTKEGKNDGDDTCFVFAKEKAPRRDKRGAFSYYVAFMVGLRGLSLVVLSITFCRHILLNT